MPGRNKGKRENAAAFVVFTDEEGKKYSIWGKHRKSDTWMFPGGLGRPGEKAQSEALHIRW